MKRFTALLGLFLLLCVAACSSKTTSANEVNPVYHAQNNPNLLSEWGMLNIEKNNLVLARQSFAYDLNSALFSDYAHKLRTVHIPGGQMPKLGNDNDRLEFPVGTIISKTFYYPKDTSSNHELKSISSIENADHSLPLEDVRLIETRILVHREDGWTALPYVWNNEQTEAVLKRVGDVLPLMIMDGGVSKEFAYIVPNTNQCAGCHATNNTTRAIVPIGPKVRHLKSLEAFGLDSMTPNASNVNWQDTSQSLEDRARAYLDINCAHCHNEVGPADTSGLHLTSDTPIGPHFGLCKLPIAAGTGTGNRKFGIVPGKPDESIFVFRMNSENPAVMMPELGRTLIHQEGVELIEDWISALNGVCSAG